VAVVAAEEVRVMELVTLDLVEAVVAEWFLLLHRL
jgi:hypothetical protein